MSLLRTDTGGTESCQTERKKKLHTELWLHDSVIPQICRNPHWRINWASVSAVSLWYSPSEEDKPPVHLLHPAAIRVKQERRGCVEPSAELKPGSRTLHGLFGSNIHAVIFFSPHRGRLMSGLVALFLPARMALWPLNSCPLTYRLQSVKRDCSHRFPRSSDSWHSGTFSMFMLDWPEMLTESWTTLTCKERAREERLTSGLPTTTGGPSVFWWTTNFKENATWDKINNAASLLIDN